VDPNSVEQITTYLDKLGEKLGVGAKMIWPWLIKQVYVESFLAWFFFLTTGAVTYIAYRYMFKHWHSNKGYSICENDHEPLWITLASVLGFLFVISTLVFVCEGFQFINPEYYALKNVLVMFKDVK
jgi:hypothetical protein